jgi:hypothetical protein
MDNGVYAQRMLTAFNRNNPVTADLTYPEIQDRFKYCKTCEKFTGKSCKVIGCDFEDHIRILFRAKRECPKGLF